MASLPLPSYSSMLSSLPRLRGDGMDSDNLNPNKQSLPGSSPPNPPPQRHRNLNSSTKAATVAKAQKPKHVPKEPTRGAVGTLNPKPAMEASHGQKKGSTTRSVRSDLNAGPPQPAAVSLSTNRIVLTPAPQPNNTQSYGFGNLSLPESAIATNGTSNLVVNKPLSVQNAERTNALGGIVTLDTNKKAQVGMTASIPTSFPPSLLINDKTGVPAPISKPADVTIDLSSVSSKGLSSQVKSVEEKLTNLKVKETVVGLVPPAEEREVEGQSQNASDVQLKSKVDSLTKELDLQTKVNTDLKKLLVASVGDDLHWKMDALIQTKTQLASEIGGYTEKLRKDYEDLDTLSIQADMWKSKFMATRVLMDQLSKDIDSLLARNMESERALKHLMQERQQLHYSMLDSHRFLKLVRDSFDPVFAQRSQSLIPNILELARTNQLLSEAIKTKLLGNMPMLTVALDAGIQNGLTPAERMAHQILTSESQPPKHVPGRLTTQHAGQFGRFHPSVREEGFSWACCRNCRGDVHIV